MSDEDSEAMRRAHAVPIEGESQRVPDEQPRAREVGQDEFCMEIARRIDKMLLSMTGLPEGGGPAFALMLWRDGAPVISYATNRTQKAMAEQCMAVLSQIASLAPEPERGPLIVRPH